VESREGGGEVTAVRVRYEESFTVAFYVAKIAGIVVALELLRGFDRCVLWMVKPIRRYRRARLEVAGE
jgi:hypothetical protein